MGARGRANAPGGVERTGWCQMHRVLAARETGRWRLRERTGRWADERWEPAGGRTHRGVSLFDRCQRVGPSSKRGHASTSSKGSPRRRRGHVIKGSQRSHGSPGGECGRKAPGGVKEWNTHQRVATLIKGSQRSQGSRGGAGGRKAPGGVKEASAGATAAQPAAGPPQPPPAPRGARQPYGQLHVIVQAAV